MMAATLASIIESIGDYHVTAQVAEVSNPPAHAINRGIFLEGLESVLSGAVGTGHGTTSYSTGIAGITITKVRNTGGNMITSSRHSLCKQGHKIMKIISSLHIHIES